MTSDVKLFHCRNASGKNNTNSFTRTYTSKEVFAALVIIKNSAFFINCLFDAMFKIGTRCVTIIKHTCPPSSHLSTQPYSYLLERSNSGIPHLLYQNM